MILLCANLAACGFRLAGSAVLPESISSIYLVTTGFSESQRVLLTKKLEQAGAAVDSKASEGATQLSVRLREVPDRTLVNSAQNGKTVERLARLLEFTVQAADGEMLIAPGSLRQQRDITLDDDNLHASNRERRDVVEDLESALFSQLIFRLQRL